MSPALSWLLVALVVTGFAAVGLLILGWLDDLLDHRRHRRYVRTNHDWWEALHHGWDEPRSIRELTTRPFDHTRD